MGFLRQALPAGLLARVRLAALIIGVVALLIQLAQVGNPTRTPLFHHLSRASILLLAGTLLVTHVRGRAQWWDLVTVPPLIVIGAAGLIDPIAGMSLALAASITISLYGRLWMWAVRTAGGIVAVPAAVALSPNSAGRAIDWHSPTVIGLLPQLVLVGVMMRGIYAALLRQEGTSAREAVLARTGRILLGVETVEDVREHGRLAAEELVALNPGVIMVVLRTGAEGLVVANGAGLPAGLRGTWLPDSARSDPAALHAVVPGVRQWRIGEVGPQVYVAVGGVRTVAEDVFDAFRNLAHQVLLAETSRLSHAELDHRAHHDQLTGLPTRAKFFRALRAAVDAGEPGTVALLNIDLDDFKQVNDVHGHGAGDDLLVEVASRIASAGGPGSMAARFGGDEFALLLTGLTGAGEAERVAERLCALLIDPVRLDTVTVTVGASIGVAVTTPAQTAGDLTRCADLAMYSAKAQGKNRVELFHPGRHGDAAEHRTREKHLAEAVERGEIHLRYRPQVAPGSGACVAVEAHAGWHHPTFGVLRAEDLLDMAARTGNLPALTRYLLGAVCAEIATVPGQVRFVVDVSGPQLADPSLAGTVRDTLAAAGLAAERLTLRIVGADAMVRIPGTLIRDGVRVVLDEQNTRTATLAALQTHPLHALTAGAGDPEALDLALAVSRVIGAGLVVQDVRTGAQEDAAVAAGATAVQGDLIAPEMTLAELAAWLTTERSLLHA